MLFLAGQFWQVDCGLGFGRKCSAVITVLILADILCQTARHEYGLVS